MSNSKDSWNLYFDIGTDHAKILKTFMLHELALYNHYIKFFNNQLRVNPDGIIDACKHLQIFGEAIEHKLSIRAMQNSEIFDKLRHLESHIRSLNKNALAIFDICLTPSNISIRTQRNMGVEILKFYNEQAKIIKMPHSKDSFFKIAPKLLEPLDMVQKRHVQLNRRDIEVVIENDISKLYIPYLKNCIEIKKNISYINWDLAIIHQKPKCIVVKDTPWLITLKRANEYYLLNYVEVFNPNKVGSFNRNVKSYKNQIF